MRPCALLCMLTCAVRRNQCLQTHAVKVRYEVITSPRVLWSLWKLPKLSLFGMARPRILRVDVTWNAACSAPTSTPAPKRDLLLIGAGTWLRGQLTLLVVRQWCSLQTRGPGSPRRPENPFDPLWVDNNLVLSSPVYTHLATVREPTSPLNVSSCSMAWPHQNRARRRVAKSWPSI